MLRLAGVSLRNDAALLIQDRSRIEPAVNQFSCSVDLSHRDARATNRYLIHDLQDWALRSTTVSSRWVSMNTKSCVKLDVKQWHESGGWSYPNSVSVAAQMNTTFRLLDWPPLWK